MPTPAYPDDREEQAVQLTFEEFVSKARELYVHMQDHTLSSQQEAQAANNFYRFVLAGRTRINNIPRHITVNACQGLNQPLHLEITRDYDSLIGATVDLPYTMHLALSPVPPFKDVLYKPNHVKSIAFRDVSRWCPLIMASSHSTSNVGSDIAGSHVQHSQLCFRQGHHPLHYSCLLATHVWQKQPEDDSLSGSSAHL